MLAATGGGVFLDHNNRWCLARATEDAMLDRFDELHLTRDSLGNSTSIASIVWVHMEYTAGRVAPGSTKCKQHITYCWATWLDHGTKDM